MRELCSDEIEIVSGGGRENQHNMVVEPEIVVTARHSPFASFMASLVESNIADGLGALGSRWGIRGSLAGSGLGHQIEQEAGSLTYTAALAFEDSWISYYEANPGWRYPDGQMP